MATESSTCSVPVRVPGGKLAIETPAVPKSQAMVVAPTLVIPALPESSPKETAEPRETNLRVSVTS